MNIIYTATFPTLEEAKAARIKKMEEGIVADWVITAEGPDTRITATEIKCSECPEENKL